MPAAIVHTKAIQAVLEPIADAIGHMIVLCNESETTGRGMPDLTGTASNIQAAVLNFVKIGREDINGSSDMVLRDEMSVACKNAEESTKSLNAAASLLKGDPTSSLGRKSLVDALKAVLNGAQLVLIANDNGEVRRVVRTANNCLDALVLVKEVRTEEDLLAVQEALSARLIQICRRVKGRIEDLFDERQISRMGDQTRIIENQTPLLFSAMRAKASNNTVASASVNETLVMSLMNGALKEIISLVQMTTYIPDWADGIGKAFAKYQALQEKLAKANLATMTPTELQQLMADIADVIRDAENLIKEGKLNEETKNALQAKIDEVKRLRNELDDILRRLADDPNNPELRRLAELKRAELQKALNDLRLAQTAAALESLQQVFADPGLTTKHVVDSAKAEDAAKFVKASKDFVDINRDMNKGVRDLAEYVENPVEAAKLRRAVKHNEDTLVPSVVHAGRVVLENPNDRAAKEHLDKMAKQWEAAKDTLEADVYKAVDPIAFTNAAKAAISSKIKDIRQAIKDQDKEAFLKGRHGLEHMVNQAIKFCENEAANTTDPAMKKMYQDAADKMKRILPKVLADADAAFARNDAASLSQFDRSAKDLLDAAELATKAAYHPTAEAERLAAERAAQLAREQAARDEATRAAEAARIAKENAFNPTTDLGKTAIPLRDEVNKWETHGNPLVLYARNMTELMKRLGDFAAANDKAGIIKTSKELAKEAEKAAKEAMDVCNICTDKRLREQLRVLAEKLPTQAMQLKIISSVKAANPQDKSVDEQMVVCAQALMGTMQEMMKAVAAACVRVNADAKKSSTALVWKRKLEDYSAISPVPLAKLLTT